MSFKEVILEILKERGLRKVDLSRNVEITTASLCNQ